MAATFLMESNETEEGDDEATREEFMDVCFQIARNDAEVDNFNHWLEQRIHSRFKLDATDIMLLGKSLAGNTHVRLLSVDMTSAYCGNKHVQDAEDALSKGLAESRVEVLGLGRPSRRLQKLLLDSSEKYIDNGGGGRVPCVLMSLEMFDTSVDTRRLSQRLLQIIPVSPSSLHNNIGNQHHGQLLLAHLILGHCKLDDTDMLTISLALVGNCSLFTLRLPHNRITNIGIMYFCENWTSDSQINEMDVSWNKFDKKGAVLLLQATTQHPALTTLMMNCNEMIGHEGIALMGEQFPHLLLTHLEMYKSIETSPWNIQHSAACHRAALALANGIRGNTTLVTLHIGANNLGSRGAKLIMQAVAAHQPAMQRFSLGFDQSVGLKGLKHIGNELPNTKLEGLQLCGIVGLWPNPQTKLAREAGQALLHGVQNNPYLTRFTFMSLDTMWMTPIEVLLDLNKTCRPLFSDSEAATPAVWPLILAYFAGQGKMSHLYFCLREQPWLMLARPM
jgi:hypothetical protein